MLDMFGNELKIGDYVIHGMDNGSTLLLGRVFKLGKKCWFYYVHKYEQDQYEIWLNNRHNRDYERVAKYTGDIHLINKGRGGIRDENGKLVERFLEF